MSSLGGTSTLGQTQTGLGLSFYYFRLLHCPDQMLVLLSQHRVLSSKTVRARAPCGGRYMGTLLGRGLPFVQLRSILNLMIEGARPHLCMNEWNH